MRDEEAAAAGQASRLWTSTSRSELCVLICQTMSSIRSVLEALEKPDKPFISRCQCSEPLRPLQTCDAHLCDCDVESGGARRVRTDDLMLAKHALYQLSYGPV